MSESESDEFYFKIQDESIRETLAELPNIIQVFHNPLYDLNETVGSDIDFHVGCSFWTNNKPFKLAILSKTGLTAYT